jgi:hypothetical protein
VRSSAAALESAEEEDEALQAELKASAAEEAARVAAEEARLAAAKMEHTLHPTHLTPSELQAIKSLLERLARDSPPDPQNFVCSNIQPPISGRLAFMIALISGTSTRKRPPSPKRIS